MAGPIINITPLTHSTSTPRSKNGPIEGLANETLLQIFTIIAEALPEYNPSTVDTDYAAFPLSHVSQRWRQVSHMCQDFWRRVVINLPGFSVSRRSPSSAASLLRLALNHCWVNVEMKVTSEDTYPDSRMQDELCRWLAARPNALTILTMDGVGAGYTLVAVSDALDGQHLSSLKALTVEIPKHDVRPTASNSVVRCVAGLLDSRSPLKTVSLSMNKSISVYTNSARRLAQGKVPVFTATHYPVTSLLSDLGTMTIVNSPALISFAQTAKLTELSVTCSTAFLKGDLMRHLANVISSSRSTLTTLSLRGWFTWGDEALLSSLRELGVLRRFKLDFYVTVGMVTLSKFDNYSVLYVDGVVACWSAVSNSQNLASVAATCVQKGGSADVNYIFQKMDIAWYKSGGKGVASYTVE